MCRFHGFGLRLRRVDVRSKLMPRDASNELDIEHAFGRHPPPLRNGLWRNLAKQFGEARSASDFGFRDIKSFFHAA